MKQNKKVLYSKIDSSINFIEDVDIGIIESRFVQRVGNKISVYVSSQTGCDQACRMCHLTSTRQTKLRDVTPDEYLQQVLGVLDAKGLSGEVARVHINFMSRGEPLNNKYLLQDSQKILRPIQDIILNENVSPRFCISTIMPKQLDKSLVDVFPTIHPEIYYSLYTTNIKTRKRWLPNAMDVDKALKLLREYQIFTNKIPKIHFAMIKGVNDSELEIQNIINKVNESNLSVNINIPSYNPNKNGGSEADESFIETALQMMSEGLPNSRVKLIPKVGFDVKASCGMFVT